MTIWVGGLRVLGANYVGSKLGVFTDKRGALNNDFFVNLLDMDTAWKTTYGTSEIFESADRTTSEELSVPIWCLVLMRN